MARHIRRRRLSQDRWNQVVASLQSMNFAFTKVRLYPPTHSEVTGELTHLLQLLALIFTEQSDLSLAFMDELLYIENSVAIDETADNQMLVNRISQCRIKYMTFRNDVSLEDLTVFFQLLNAEATKSSGVPPSEQLAAKGIKTIRIVEASLEDVSGKAGFGRKQTLFDWHTQAVEALKISEEQIREGDQGKDLKQLFRVVDDMVSVILSKGCDPFLLLPCMRTGLDLHLSHSVNVAVLCCALGDLAGLSSSQVTELCLCALLHDVGRNAVPAEWLAHHRPLSDAERGRVSWHAERGLLLLERDSRIDPQAGLLAAIHHEPPRREGKSDDSPASFHGLLALADAYDLAQFNNRYYWKPQSQHRMIRHLLHDMETGHDPLLLKLLINCVGYYPPGCLVRLDDGQRGLIVRPNPLNAMRPRVWLFDAPEEPSKESDKPVPVIVDADELDESGVAFKRSVAAVLSPPSDLDIPALLDKKKDYLLHHSL